MQVKYRWENKGGNGAPMPVVWSWVLPSLEKRSFVQEIYLSLSLNLALSEIQSINLATLLSQR